MMEYTQLWIIFEQMKEYIECEELLDSFAQAITTDLLEETLRTIDKSHDLNLFEQ